MPDIKRLADGIYLQVFYVFGGKIEKIFVPLQPLNLRIKL